MMCDVCMCMWAHKWHSEHFRSEYNLRCWSWFCVRKDLFVPFPNFLISICLPSFPLELASIIQASWLMCLREFSNSVSCIPLRNTGIQTSTTVLSSTWFLAWKCTSSSQQTFGALSHLLSPSMCLLKGRGGNQQ